MIALFWNCWGMGQPSAVRILRNYVISHRPSVIFLSEVKNSNIDIVGRLMGSLGFDNFEFVPARGRSGGLLFGWKVNLNISILLSTESFVNCIIHNHPAETPWQLTTIYAPPTPVGRHQFWDSVMQIGEAFHGPWCVAGDFNMVMDAMDKKGGRQMVSSSRFNLRQLTDDLGLIDLGFTGKRFTWNNRRSGLDNIQERIDRGFANDAWRMLFPHANITHLVALKSDHCPLMLQTNPTVHHLPRPFRFESMWTLTPEAAIVI